VGPNMKDISTAPADMPIPQPEDSQPAAAQRYRAIWLSDIHLGQRSCAAESLLDFLKHHDAEQWYLVGDILDGKSLDQTLNWPQLHNDVVQKMLRKARKGARVVFIPGNHDRFLLGFSRHSFGVILVLPETMHETADQRLLWVVHGDQFDSVVQYAPWLSFFGKKHQDRLLPAGRFLNRIRRKLGFAEWSLSAHIQSDTETRNPTSAPFVEALLHAARRKGTDGVICGHTHKAEIRKVNGQLYCNTGDWVHSCTALVEHFDGRLELIHWKGESRAG